MYKFTKHHIKKSQYALSPSTIFVNAWFRIGSKTKKFDLGSLPLVVTNQI